MNIKKSDALSQVVSEPYALNIFSHYFILRSKIDRVGTILKISTNKIDRVGKILQGHLQYIAQ